MCTRALLNRKASFNIQTQENEDSPFLFQVQYVTTEMFTPDNTRRKWRRGDVENKVTKVRSKTFRKFDENIASECS